MINSYFRQETSELGEVSSSHSPPLGLGYVGTYIKDHSDCEVEIVDPVPQRLTVEDVLKKASRADYVGLSCYTDIRFQCFELAERIKERSPDCVVIVGGPHVYYLDEAIMRHYPVIDILVRGEGEKTALEIVKGLPLSEIKGITYKIDGRVARNPDRPFFENIDDLYIDYSLLPDMSLYEADIEAPIDFKKLKTAYLIESRGCPFKCSYCANDHWKRTWRATSGAAIVDKMERLMKNYGVEYFRFYDDLFTMNKKRVLEFCEEIKRRGLKVNFRVLVRAGTDREILKALKEAGCESVGFGIESGSDAILRRINKGITRQQIIETVRICKDLGLWVVGSFIISLPDETEKDFRESLSLMKYPDVYMVNVLMIYPYTPFYNELKAKGEIDDEIWFEKKFPNRIFYTKDNFSSASFSNGELEWLKVYCAYYGFIHNPKALFRKHGFGGGVLRFALALFDIPLRGRIYALYGRLKERHLIPKRLLRMRL